MSGRLVQPCAECGAKLRMSSMAAVSSVAALGLIGTAVVYVWADPEWRSYLLFVALGLLLVILIAMLATRIESVPPAPAAIEPPPERIGKKRM